MTAAGKHAKEARTVKVGQHGVAVQPRFSWRQATIGIIIALAICLVPLVMAFSHGDLETRAFGDTEDTTFSTLNDAANNPNGLKLPTTRAPYAANVTEKLQNSVMSGGCELVSLAIVMDSMGIDFDLHEFVNKYLDVNGHFATGYSGDPYSCGAGYPLGITAAANRYLAATDADVRAHNLTDVPFSDLRKLVDLGYPVMFWTTMGFTDPEFTDVYDNDQEWYENEHCVVVYGFDRGGALVSDPLEGLVIRDASRFADIYEQCGSMALAIY